MARPDLIHVADLDAALTDTRFDAVIWVTADIHAGPDPIAASIKARAAIDTRLGDAPALLSAPGLPGNRLVVAPTGRLDRIQDDVRRISDAAAAGIALARDAGARTPVIVASVPADAFARTDEALALGALDGLWAPLSAREALGEAACEPITHVGVVAPQAVLDLAAAIEDGRRLARDLCGTEPERMRPQAFADYCVEAFAGTAVQVEVKTDVDAYPLLSAVARASTVVERHRPCVARLTYTPAGPVHTTLLLAGKGVTYDTGGADLKPSGHMAGMSRDKGGAAAAAGMMLSIATLAPAGVAVIAELGLVRNSVGPDSFVTDEIIKSHAGVRVRIGNTDAEGRLVMADLLSHLRLDAEKVPGPHLFTVATLTGHAVIAMGEYSVAVDNKPARAERTAETIAAIGEVWGDPLELSRLRREDFAIIAPRTANEDVISCNNLPSSGTPRGHQFPMAFLARASGLEDGPYRYTHLDIAGAATIGSDWQHGRPTGRPVAALTAWTLMLAERFAPATEAVCDA